jgi:amino acid transporter
LLDSIPVEELLSLLTDFFFQHHAMTGSNISQSYLFVGTIVFSVMVSLGEMATYIPVAGAFTAFATRFVDPTLGFSMGYIYWFSWAITYALELTASGIIIQYWEESVNIGIFIGVFWVVFTGVNLLPVKFYGEIEFWFASIKVITVVGFMIFAICVGLWSRISTISWIPVRLVLTCPFTIKSNFHSNWVHPGPFAPYLLDQVGGNENLAKFVGFWATLSKLLNLRLFIVPC